MARAYLALRNGAAGAALIAAGIGIGEADFKPTVSKTHAIQEARQVQTGSPNCGRLDAVEAALAALAASRSIPRPSGHIEAVAVTTDPSVCWQVDGFHVVTGSPHCARLDAVAAAVAGIARTRDEFNYTAASFIAQRLDDAAVCWQVDLVLAIPMTCRED